MTLLAATEPTYSAVSSGRENGVSTLGEGIAVLDPRIEWMRFCAVCDREQRFVALLACERGLVGFCSSCGHEQIATFTRTNGQTNV